MTLSMSSVVGALQSIAQDALPQLESIDALSLPDNGEAGA
jgi:hypothetical protein